MLLLHRSLGATQVLAGITAALSVGSISADVIAVQARKASRAGDPSRTTTPNAEGGVVGGDGPPPVVNLAQRRAELPADTRPLPSVAAYDQLLGGAGQLVTRPAGVTEQAAEAAIAQACRLLRLPTMREHFAEFADVAAREQMTFQASLAELLLAETDDREARNRARRIHNANFPRNKHLDDFDYQANPNINPATIAAMTKADWAGAGEPLCLIGDSGTGKSHLLIGLGTAAALHEPPTEGREAVRRVELTATVSRHGLFGLGRSLSWLREQAGNVSVEIRITAAGAGDGFDRVALRNGFVEPIEEGNAQISELRRQE